MKHEERRALLLELQKSRAFIEQNWNDELGRQFTAWVSQAEEALGQAEQQSEACTKTADGIWSWCREILETKGEPEDPPKILKLEHRPPQQR